MRMEYEEIQDQKFSNEQEIVSLVFPKDRDVYVQKLLAQIGLMAFVVWIIFFKSEGDNIYSIAFSSLIGVALLVVIYEKIVFFFKVDKISATVNSLKLFYKNSLIGIYPFKRVGLKIVSDIGGTYEISFYDLSEKKKLFYCKENEVEQNNLQALLLHLQKTTGMDSSIIKDGTHGEVIPLVELNDMSYSSSMERYYDKHYFYDLSGYGWMIYPFVVIVVLITLYFIN